MERQIIEVLIRPIAQTTHTGTANFPIYLHRRFADVQRGETAQVDGRFLDLLFLQIA
jgi:hypothetical protein